MGKVTWVGIQQATRKFTAVVHRLPRRTVSVLVAAVLFAVLGTTFLMMSRAMTASMAVEPESGQLMNGAARVDDTSASGGAAVRFGAATADSGPIKTSLSGTRTPVITPPVSLSAGTPLYVYVNDATLKSVAFVAKDSSGAVLVNRSEVNNPFDLIGAAAGGIDAAAWTPNQGEYTITATVTYADNRQEVFTLRVQITAGTSTPNPGTTTPAPVTGDLYNSWKAAWDEMMRRKDNEYLQNWFAAQKFGQRIPLAGRPVYTGPSTITTQAQADQLAGKKVTKDIILQDGTFTVRDAYFEEARLDQQSGNVTYRDILVDAKGGDRWPNYFRIGGPGGGTADLERIEIRNNQDGLQTWPKKPGTGNWVKLRYVYIHSVAKSTGMLGKRGDCECNTHTDGIQHMAGFLDTSYTYIDYNGMRNSVLQFKTDHGNASVKASYNVWEANMGRVARLQDNPDTGFRWTSMEFKNNAIAGKGSEQIFDLWRLNSAMVNSLKNQTVTLLPSGSVIPIVNAITYR